MSLSRDTARESPETDGRGWEMARQLGARASPPTPTPAMSTPAAPCEESGQVGSPHFKD